MGEFTDLQSRSEIEEVVKRIDDRNTHPDKDEWKNWNYARTVSSAQAYRYAPWNLDLAQLDEWVQRVVIEYADWDSLIHAEYENGKLLDRSAVYIVLANPSNKHFTETWEIPEGKVRRVATTHEWFLAHPLPDDGGPIQRNAEGYCDRCSDIARVTADDTQRRTLHPVHIPRFGIVVEVMLCRGCLLQMQHQTRRSISLAKPRG